MEPCGDNELRRVTNPWMKIFGGSRSVDGTAELFCVQFWVKRSDFLVILGVFRTAVLAKQLRLDKNWALLK
jgi:hypothetical protein